VSKLSQSRWETKEGRKKGKEPIQFKKKKNLPEFVEIP
jgi:hypothetical protein